MLKKIKRNGWASARAGVGWWVQSMREREERRDKREEGRKREEEREDRRKIREEERKKRDETGSHVSCGHHICT